eukprot:Clim_evm96s108 gene=Clim_evmTU96s108
MSEHEDPKSDQQVVSEEEGEQLQDDAEIKEEIRMNEEDISSYVFDGTARKRHGRLHEWLVMMLAKLSRRRIADTRLHLLDKNQWHKYRYELGCFLEDMPFQLFIVVLLIMDIVVIISEAIVHVNCEEPEDKIEEVEDRLFYISISILLFIELEQILLMICFGRDYFKHFWYVLDFVVVTVALILELFVARAAGVVIVVMLWRVVRVLHGFAAAIEIDYELIKNYRRDNMEMKKKVEALRAELEELQAQVDEKEKEKRRHEQEQGPRVSSVIAVDTVVTGNESESGSVHLKDSGSETTDNT